MSEREIGWPPKDADQKDMHLGFYRHVGAKYDHKHHVNGTGEIIEIHDDPPGFRVNSGYDGKRVNVFEVSKAREYHRVSEDELRQELEKTRRRVAWFERGIAKY